MNKKKGSVLITMVLILSSMSIVFAAWDEGHSVFKLGADRSSSSTFFGEIEEYSVGNAEIEIGSIKEVDINWHNGDVNMMEYEGDKIKIEEISETVLSSDERLRYLSKNGKLIIRYANETESSLADDNLYKELNVYIPKRDKNLINEIKLSTINSNSKIDVNNRGNLRVDSVNGNMEIFGSYEGLEFSSTSGNVDLYMKSCPSNMNINAVNGDINLKLPENDGFEVEYDIKNGDFVCEFPVTSKGNYAIYKKAKSDFNLFTVNGNISITKYTTI